MKKVILYSGKGGVGKSPLCIEMAIRFARLGKRVLGIDLDHQAQFTLGLAAAPDNALYDFVSSRNGHISNFVKPTRIQNLSLLSSGDSSNVAQSIAFAKHLSSAWLDEALRTVDDEYDIAIIDTAQGGLFVDMAIAAADMVVSPIRCVYAHVEALTATPGYVASIRQAAGKFYPQTVVVPISGGKSKHTDSVFAELQELVGAHQPDPTSPQALDNWALFEMEGQSKDGEVIALPVPVTVDIDNAKALPTPLSLLEYRPKSPVSVAYNRLVAELSVVLWGAA